MRRAVLVVTFASWAGLFLLSLVGLVLVCRNEVTMLVLPDTTGVQIEQSSLSRQEITYRLPPNQTPDDLYAHLVQDGWARDMRGELARLRAQRGTDAFVVFWRQTIGDLLTGEARLLDLHANGIGQNERSGFAAVDQRQPYEAEQEQPGPTCERHYEHRSSHDFPPVARLRCHYGSRLPSDTASQHRLCMRVIKH
jgi:hypothetical protein